MENSIKGGWQPVVGGKLAAEKVMKNRLNLRLIKKYEEMMNRI